MSLCPIFNPHSSTVRYCLLTANLPFGIIRAMNIKQEIQNALERLGWTATKLANEAGVAPPVLTRFLSGDRDGIHSKTLEKLWPFIYGDKRPKPTEDKAA